MCIRDSTTSNPPPLNISNPTSEARITGETIVMKVKSRTISSVYLLNSKVVIIIIICYRLIFRTLAIFSETILNEQFVV